MEAVLPPRKHLAISGDNLGCLNLVRMWGCHWVEARDAAKHSTVRGWDIPHNRELAGTK